MENQNMNQNIEFCELHLFTECYLYSLIVQLTGFGSKCYQKSMSFTSQRTSIKFSIVHSL